MQWSFTRPLMKSWQHMRHFFFPYLVLAFSLAVTFTLWVLARQSVEREGRIRFETRTREIANAIESRMRTYVQTLYQTRGFMQTRGIPSREEFATYIRSVNIASNYPGIQGIGFSLRILPSELSSHIASMQAQGFIHYRLHPPGQRMEYHSIIMLEPFDWRNQRAFGYDMHTDPVRQKAMDSARDRGLPHVTDRVTLLQETETDRQPGFLVYLPLYQADATPGSVADRRKTLLGYVYSPFRAHDLFDGIFGEPDANIEVDFQVFDQSTMTPEGLLYDRDRNFQTPGDHRPQFLTTLTVHVPGRTWILSAQSLPNFAQRIANSVPSYVLGTGLSLSFLIFFLFLGHAIKVRNEHLLQASIAIDKAALFHKAENELLRRRKAEDDLRNLNEQLEARVRDRTAQLQAANHELEAFAYSVSHDLRAPLRGIDGFATILEKRYKASLDEQGRHYLKRVKDAAGRMSHLIDDMLNLTRLTRQEMQTLPLDLTALAHAVARFLLEAESQRQVDFRIQDGMQVVADPVLMRAVLENLMGNAWKFTSHRSSGVLIEVGSETRDETTVYFVKDNGAGFDMDYAEKLFRPFQRLHSTHEFPGSGIGLASVQRVIHRHGGKVWAEGRVNEGATFYFTLACSERNTA